MHEEEDILIFCCNFQYLYVSWLFPDKQSFQHGIDQRTPRCLRTQIVYADRSLTSCLARSALTRCVCSPWSRFWNIRQSTWWNRDHRPERTARGVRWRADVHSAWTADTLALICGNIFHHKTDVLFNKSVLNFLHFRKGCNGTERSRRGRHRFILKYRTSVMRRIEQICVCIHMISELHWP